VLAVTHDAFLIVWFGSKQPTSPARSPKAINQSFLYPMQYVPLGRVQSNGGIAYEQKFEQVIKREIRKFWPYIHPRGSYQSRIRTASGGLRYKSLAAITLRLCCRCTHIDRAVPFLLGDVFVMRQEYGISMCSNPCGRSCESTR